MPSPPPSDPEPPLVIGLLGGIASGKSTVGSVFAEHGFRVVDADRIAREAVAGPDCLARIRDRFGPGVIAGDGSLRRDALAQVVFADPQARRDLEAIVHPRVREVVLAELAAARVAATPVVLDVPLLLEGGLIAECTHAVFLEAAEAVRLERARSRGWDEGELRRREASQAPLADKRARADFTVRTDGPLAATRRQVEELIRTLGP